MDEKSQLTHELQSRMPFAKLCGIRLVAAAPTEVRGELDWNSELCTSGGVIHGGALVTFADTLGALCAFLNLPKGASTTTVESKTNFFRAFRSGRAHALAVPLHVGRMLIVVQIDIRDDEGRRMAIVTQSQAVLTTS